MLRFLPGGMRVAAAMLALGVFLTSAGSVLAHARLDYAVPAAGSALDGTPFVLTVYFTQELTSRSTLRVLDANGVQVDLGDGRVDLDDPDRKVMLVSLPELPVGVYTVEFAAESAEDGHVEPGTFAFGVGMAPPSAEQPVDALPAGDLPASEPPASDVPAGDLPAEESPYSGS